MINRQDELLKRLLNLPNPLEEGMGLWLDYADLGVNESDVADLLDLMTDESLAFADSNTKEVWIPLHCWRALAQLRSLEAFGPILALHEEFPEDDWLSSDLAKIAILIGKDTLPPMAAYLARKDKDESIRGNVADSIASLGCHYPDIRDNCIRVLRDQLTKFKKNPPTLNGFIISALMDLMALDCLSIIRLAYKADAVDLSICGDMEDVEIELGLRNERLTPPQFAFFPDDDNFQVTNPSDDNSPFPSSEKVGRNDPCPCGSGKKFKKCCLN